MATIARFVRLDLLSLRPQLRSICFLFVFVIALCAIQQTEPSLAVACIASAGAFFLPQFLFAHDEVGRLNTLYSILGVNRRTVVIGRYLTCFALTLVMLAASLLVTSLIGVFLHQLLTLQQLAALLLLCIFGASLLLAINLPGYFTFGVVKARLIGVACTTVLLTATVFAAQHLLNQSLRLPSG